MRKKILLLTFILYIIFTIGNVYALENGVTIPLVAARISDKGEEGIYLNAQVIVKNGTGHVFVDTNPYTQVDLQGSARIAAMVASDVLGEDQRLYDFYYIIEVDTPIVGGPSAGGALAVATIAAMKNWTIKRNVAMTGTINPDETIGPVGGIPHKLEAAAAKGTKIFLVPQGQLIVNETNITSIEEHYKNGSKLKKDIFNVGQLGMKLNVAVKEVSTVQEAVLEFTGYDISKPLSNETVFSSEYLKLLEPLADRLKNESKDMYNNISFIDNNLTKNAKELQNRADNLTNDKKYYGATSLYFQSMINLLTAEWINQYSQEKNKSEYISNLIGIVDKQIKDSENDLYKFKSNGISDVNIVGAAESRIMEASNTLEKVKALSNVSNANVTISSLAFSYQRAKSAQWWLTLATPSELIIPEYILRERAGWYMSQAMSISTYTETLISESQRNMPNGMFDTTTIQKEIQRGYYSGAIFDSLQVISMSGSAIRFFSTEDLSDNINQSANLSQTVINDVRSKGIEPTLAVSAHEFGEISHNPYNKMVQYTYAKMIAKTTQALYSRSVSTNKSGKENVSDTTSKRSPGFNAIILLIVIFAIRRMKM